MSVRFAYFSMEIALAPSMRTYSGGLGMLSGDTVRGFADLGLSAVGITLLHRKGYFCQYIDETGWQHGEPDSWNIEQYLTEQEKRIQVTIAGRTVHVRAWEYRVKGITGRVVPVYLLDTDLQENSDYDRTLTDHLYGGDLYYRLCQEIVLGIGGVRMLRALGYEEITRFHMNEGHSALLTMELLDEQGQKSERTSFSNEDIAAVRKLCVFTTHTPVPAGHDKFPLDMAIQTLGRQDIRDMCDVFCYKGELNMTYLALNLSDRINGVAKRHGQISQQMFPNYDIDSITNGVHVRTWAAKPFVALFDEYIPDWCEDNFSLRYVLRIPASKIRAAHEEAKRNLITWVNSQMNTSLRTDVFTLGFARRATPYKRADLLMHDLDRLNAIAGEVGEIQVIYGGKAHPHDHQGKEQIKRVIQSNKRFSDRIHLVYLPNYDWELGALITAGVDVWLNTPLPPNEASGTSGMKAAINGVPSLSILDGWWLEGCIENRTGWAIGDRYDQLSSPVSADPTAHDADSLYNKLENVVMPLYYNDPEGFLEVMINAIALNGSFFTAQRMVLQYISRVYFR